MKKNTIRSDAQSHHRASSTNTMSLSGIWQRHAAAQQPIWSLARWRRILKKYFA